MKINPLKAEKLMEMNVFMQKLQIRQKTCYIEQNGSGGPIILWGMYPHRGNEIAHMWDCLMETYFALCLWNHWILDKTAPPLYIADE